MIENENISEKIKALPIEALDLSLRSFNCLKRAGKDTIGDLLPMSEEDFMKVRNLGRKSMEEVIDKLTQIQGIKDSQLKFIDPYANDPQWIKDIRENIGSGWTINIDEDDRISIEDSRYIIPDLKNIGVSDKTALITALKSKHRQIERYGWRLNRLIDSLHDEFVTCGFCGASIEFRKQDNEKGAVWHCEECHGYFCEACFLEKHSAGALYAMKIEKRMECPDCRWHFHEKIYGPIEEQGLSEKSLAELKQAGIKTLYEMINKSEYELTRTWGLSLECGNETHEKIRELRALDRKEE